MNNQAKDKNPNTQEATTWIAITYKNDQEFGLKINNKKNQLVDWKPGLPEVKGLSHWPFRQGTIWKCLIFLEKQNKFL